MIIQKKQERRRRRHEIRSAQQLRESSPEENPPPSEPYQKENTMPAKLSSASSKYNKPVAEVHPHSAPHHQSSFTSGQYPRVKDFRFLIYLVILWHRVMGEYRCFIMLHCLRKGCIMSRWCFIADVILIIVAFGRTTHTDPKDMRARQHSRQKMNDQIPPSYSSSAAVSRLPVGGHVYRCLRINKR